MTMTTATTTTDTFGVKTAKNFFLQIIDAACEYDTYRDYYKTIADMAAGMRDHGVPEYQIDKQLYSSTDCPGIICRCFHADGIEIDIYAVVRGYPADDENDTTVNHIDLQELTACDEEGNDIDGSAIKATLDVLIDEFNRTGRIL